MLGAVGRDLCLNLLQALAKLDGPGLLDEVARIAELTPDFAGVLQDLIGLLHRIALYQQVPATLGDEDPDREGIAELSGQLSAEDVQLFYQIALLGQQDLPLAPDLRAGIEMILLRMLTFRPDTGNPAGTERRRKESQVRPASPSPDVPVEGGAGSCGDASTGRAAAALSAARQSIASGSPAQNNETPPPSGLATGFVPNLPSGEPERARPASSPVTEAAVVSAASETRAQEPLPTGDRSLRGPEDWHSLVASLGLGGVASQLAHNCELAGWDERKLSLTLDPECRNLRVPFAEERLKGVLAGVLGKEIELEIRIARPEHETPTRRQARHHTERRMQAEALMEDDPVARTLQDELGARWVSGSIEAME